jgi:GT2 family glycosyltransferase
MEHGIMPRVDVLLPTYNRLESLILTLSGLAIQTLSDFRLIVADQSDQPAANHPVIQAVLGTIEVRAGRVEWHTRRQVHGIAEQREFLLSQATADYILYLDDDVLMESWVLERLVGVLDRQRCGFVGAFPMQTRYRDDLRPDQQRLDLWEGPVRPEAVSPDSAAWERANLHRAANLYHAAQRLSGEGTRLYKVAWVASCVLYDRRKVEEVGGFAFWPRLPRYHSGEEVVVQNLLLRRWGGCAIMPSGTYFSQLPSTVLNSSGTVDGHALDLLPELIARYAPEITAANTGLAHGAGVS